MNGAVGIRELRQDLSRYLQRVRAGERLVITDRNRPVALMSPLEGPDDMLEALIAEGRATRPTGSVRDLTPRKLDLEDPYALSRALDETRGDR